VANRLEYLDADYEVCFIRADGWLQRSSFCPVARLNVQRNSPPKIIGINGPFLPLTSQSL
jgi:hypothetical protein